jgi:hypothetical protein
VLESPQNLGRVGCGPSYCRVKALLLILGITHRLFMRELGYSNLLLRIYAVPRGGGIINML